MSAAATTTTTSSTTHKSQTTNTTQSNISNISTVSTSTSATPVISCPNFDEPLDLQLMSSEMDIDLKTSKSLSGKQYILAIPITKFFRNVRNMYALVNILNGQSIISLRLIEYFVVNYVLENNTFFDINRYNKCPEYLIRNLREKVFEMPAQSLDMQPGVNSQQQIDKHPSLIATEQTNSLAASITAQQMAYKKARDEIIADIQAKSAASKSNSSAGKSKQTVTGTTRPVKKQPITLETFFSQRAITDYTAAQKLQQQQQPAANQAPKNFDNYIIVHDNYKCQLKEYNKKNFDPFCRWNRIRMYYDKNKFFYTTIAQLNFFKWAIEKHILDYVIENLDTIEKSMNEYEKSVKAEKQLRKARQLLEKNAASTESTSNATVTSTQPAQETSSENQTGGATELTKPTNELLPISLLSTRKTVKKNIVLGNPEVKSKVKERKKKEFTKTNRSILVFSAYKVVSFD